ncbi:MAG: undecaprenyl/decaprenyl-phosphate alpha-N-acetylglucosaminyl 1-phosphate transferase [Polyangiales bacterium]|nr:undecaprenyl/decaprenyl-phosphate alpha-N-acetylglucosaminyl 1-phosphate transferase [Sandaracinaceae bacterium]
MRSSAAGLLGAFLVSLALIPFAKWVARRVGAVDVGGGRRVHDGSIPRLGGIAVVLGFFVPLVALFFTESYVASIFYSQPKRIMGLLGGGLIVATLGALDDVRGVRPRTKLAVQTLAALLAYTCGYRIEGMLLPFVGTVHLGWLSVPATCFWFVAIINALNLIDGLDGLAGGVAFFACVGNFVVAVIGDAYMVMLLSATLAGAIVGFLVFNFNPASIFMGDSGSMFLGFVLAATSLLGALVKNTTVVAIAVPVMVLGLPIADTAIAMLRRALTQRPIMTADRGHIHHRLLDLGLTHRRAVLTLYGVCAALTIAAVAASLGRGLETTIALVLFAIVLAGLVRVAGVFDRAMVAAQRRNRPLNDVTARVRAALPDAMLALTPETRGADLHAVLDRFVREAGLRHAGFADGSEPTAGPDVVRCACGDEYLDFTVSDARQAGPELQLALDVYASVIAAVHERDHHRPISERAPRPDALAVGE